MDFDQEILCNFFRKMIAVGKRCLHSFLWFINHISQGKAPKEYGLLLGEAECVPAPTKVRLIQMVQTIRKLICSIYAARIDVEHFGNLQLGIKRRFGTEYIVHGIQIDNNPCVDKIFIDFQNAFNYMAR